MHLLEVAKALRFQSGVPLKLWGHCIFTAISIINRLPSKLLADKSPFEVCFHKKPYFKHLRTFGCLCYCSILHKVDKLASRVVKAIFMGYSSVTKGYILCNNPKK